MFVLENSYMSVSINEKGAELASLVHDGKEYLWNADATYWGRTAPVLFPFVGSVSGGSYRYDGNEYKMGQHGFARDMVFELEEKTEDSIWFSLKDNEETFAKYPFHFKLLVGYVIEKNKLFVKWKVDNTDSKDLLFSIGGHPAFMCPIDGQGAQTDYNLVLKKAGKAVDSVKVGILAAGLLSDESFELKAENGLHKIEADLFDRDALIIEDKQLDEVALAYSDGTPYVTVKFDTPLMGIWSPTGKNAPFVCIEPWYGRCDREGFAGELGEREYGIKLATGEVFEGGFEVLIECADVQLDVSSFL